MSFIDNIVTWLLIIAGWWIVHALHEVRNFRSSLRQLAAEVRESASDLRKKAYNYHTASQHNDELSGDIKRDLQRLAALCRFLQPVYSEKEINQHIKNLRRAITSENFDSPINHRKLDVNDPVLTNIDVATDDLVFFVENAYFTIQASFPVRLILLTRNRRI